MKYAVIAHSGKQFKVTEGEVIQLDKMSLSVGNEVEFQEVMMLQGPDGTLFGTPCIDNARVTGRVVCHLRGKKILIFKHKRRKNYRRTMGHRQNYTQVKIETIIVPGN